MKLFLNRLAVSCLVLGCLFASPLAAQTADSTGLPLTVLELSARNQDGLMVVEWTSIDEDALSHYTLEYSADGQQYTPLITAPSSQQGTLAAYKYTITHYPAEQEHHYYRLLASAMDGRREEKGMVHIGRSGSLTTTLHPNPAKKSRFPSVIPAERPKLVQLRHKNGQLLKEYKQRKKTMLLIPIQDIKYDTYLLRVYMQSAE